jgi:tRNA A-37 threonylcarbamoyl transferase component Bud32
METDPTQPRLDDGAHPSLVELRDPSHPKVATHLTSCEMCRRLVGQSGLELPNGLVSEAAFRWPADAMARGGMAQIFLADDRRLARQVILKAPRDGEELPVPLLQMFQQRIAAEAKVLAKLQHPSIVTIYELGRASTGWPFCVLEKVEGRSLREQLDELAVDEAAAGAPRTRARLELLSSLTSVAEAIAYAHERRVVHRDITPNNILLGKRGEATLIDWGIARDLDQPSSMEIDLDLVDPSASGRMVTISAGTPPYIPFEQSQGRAAEPSFDVYSFGVCLYEVVSGRTPFVWKALPEQSEREAQMQAFLRWLASKEQAPPAAPRDAELSGIIARAMHRDPAQRFTADELVRALKQYLTGDLVFSHRYSLTGRVARWVRRRPAVAASISIALIAVVVTAVVWAQLSRAAQLAAEQRQVAILYANERKDDAERAMVEAEQARKEAAEAEKDGKDARKLKELADQKRRAAESMRTTAEQAADRAKGDADEALARFHEAEKAKALAEKERDFSRLAQQTAESQRDAAETSRQGAAAERDAARTAERAAVEERGQAQAARQVAEQERDAAAAARELAKQQEAQAKVERDEARAEVGPLQQQVAESRRQISNLEARIRELEQQLGGGGGQPPPAPPPPPAP